jgi:hypothetical protein
MTFEFERAFPFLRPSGILIADEAVRNPAFSGFGCQGPLSDGATHPRRENLAER